MRTGSKTTVVSFALALAALSAAAAQPPAPAQSPAQAQPQQSGAMQGFQVNRDLPVKIESNSLEVRDKSRQATFSGEVKLTQGETTIQCQTLVVFYEDTPASTATAAKKGAPAAQKTAAAPTPAPGGQQIKLVEARGDVLVTQKDQTARGDKGVFDAKANTVLLTGNVAVTQGTNVLRGERMLVNLTTGITTVESDKADKTKRVEGLFNPSSAPKDNKPAQPSPPGPAPAAPAPPPPAAKASPGAPTRIN
jgi:lipopolysaccharide export system protein LptA